MIPFDLLFNGLGAVLLGRPPRWNSPSGLFRSLKYREGEVVGVSRRSITLDDIDEKVELMKSSPLAVYRRNAEGLVGSIVFHHEDGDLELQGFYMTDDGRTYVAICRRHGRECNFTIKELRKYLGVRQGVFGARDSSRARNPPRRAFPGIPTSDN